MSSWLTRQRKADLVDLADEADLKGASAMKKDDLVTRLDEHLKANQARYGKSAAFSQYYGTSVFNKPTSSEMAVVPDSADAKPAKPKQRRQTTGPTTDSKDEPSSSTVTTTGATTTSTSTTNALTTKTPRALSKAAAKIPLPASPSDVSALVDKHTANLNRRVSAYLDSSGIDENLSALRKSLSTIHFIQLFFILAEAYGIQREVLPWRLAFSLTIPFTQYLGFENSVVPVSFPDFFVLLTSAFWAPTLFWVAISLATPLAVAYMINLTTAAGVSKKHALRFDPLTYSVAKIITSWLVFMKGFRFGNAVSERTVDAVEGTLVGGAGGLQVGAVITGVFALWDAVLRK